MVHFFLLELQPEVLEMFVDKVEKKLKIVDDTEDDGKLGKPQKKLFF